MKEIEITAKPQPDGTFKFKISLDNENISEKRQVKLNEFCNMFDIPYRTAIELIHSNGFPAKKIGGRWYVDIPGYYKWRETEHIRQYKYA